MLVVPGSGDFAPLEITLGRVTMPEAPRDILPDHIGHRERLRRRLIEHGGEGLHDYEVIEYLLALAIPRRDTKPLAKALIEAFGGIGAVLNADAAALLRVPGMGDGAVASLMIVRTAAVRLLRNEVERRPILGNWQALIDYLRADLAHAPIERVRVLHLNSRNILIRDELMSEGSIDEAALYVREVIRRAIDLGSAAIILVHNHPSGDPAPSRVDIDITRKMRDAAGPMGIILHDHVIVGMQGHASLRALGLL